jgi:hypothetical protein
MRRTFSQQAATSGSATSGSLRVRGSSILTIVCCDRETYTAYSNNAWTEYVVTDDAYAQLGPAIQDIMPHVEGEAIETDFKYKLVVQRSYRGGSWVDAGSGDLLAAQTTEGYKTATNPFTNRADIGLRTWVVLRTQLVNAGDPKSGTLSITLAVRLFTT